MKPSNQEIARKLREDASRLERTGDNLYRIRAYRQAAIAVMGLPQQVAVIVATEGPAALQRVPGIGKSLASTIARYVERLVGKQDYGTASHLTN